MISVEEFIKPLGSSFTAKSAPQQVVIFGWYLHAVREQANFGTGDIAPALMRLMSPGPQTLPRR